MYISVLVLVCMLRYAITQNVPLPAASTHLLMGGLTGFKLFYGADCVSTTTTTSIELENQDEGPRIEVELELEMELEEK